MEQECAGYFSEPDDAAVPEGQALSTGRQAAWIVNIIKDKCPEQLKMPFALWTREAVRDLIHRKCGIRYSVRMVGRLLRRWGFTPQKPAARTYERDDARIRHWLQHKYPALRRRAKREKAEIYWEDEMGLRSDHVAGRSYAPRGQTPILRNTGRRFGCNVISAVNTLGKMRFRVFLGSFTQSVMIDFLERLIRDARRKIIIIADGHPAHKGKRLKQWLDKHATQCELVLLPEYAPEWNPDELLNQDLKSNVFTSGRPHTREELMAQTRSYLMATQKRTDIVRAYFQEPHVHYAAN